MPKWGLTSHAEERSPIVSIKYLNEKCSWWGMISLLALSPTFCKMSLKDIEFIQFNRNCQLVPLNINLKVDH